jgi:tetratricopeptide (TPR) repeat protein
MRALVLAAALALAPSGVLQNEEAKAAFARAQQMFDAGDYAAAVPELKAAYALEPNPLLLYAWAQAERLSGNCPRAVVLYRRFLDTEPDAQQAGLARANILDCEAEGSTEASAEEPTPDPAPEPVPVEVEPTPEPEPQDVERPAWYRDWLGGTLVGVGVAGTVSGGVLLALSQSRADEAADAGSEGRYRDEVEGAERMHTAGWVLVGVGAGAIVGGIIRYAVLAKRPARDDVAFGIGPRGVVLRGRF